MRPKSKTPWFVSTAVTAACLTAGTLSVRAADIDVFTHQVGGYYGPYLDTDFPGSPDDDPPLFAPDIDPDEQVYFVGRSTFEGATTSERRAYFIYDMSSVSIPSGEMVTDVTVDLVVVDGGTSALANFSGDLEFVEFSGTPFTKEDILGEADIPKDPIAMWDSFGTGPSYGGFEFVSTLHPTLPPTIPGTYSVPLPGSFADVTDTITAGEYFILTMRLDTYDPDPIDPEPTDLYEYVFGLTDVVDGGFPTALPPPVLSITTAPIPEPSSLAMLGLGGLFASRRRRRR